jgi:hypothetical protein
MSDTVRLEPPTTFIEFPPMQRGTSFNLSALREELEKKWRLMPRRAAH